MIKNFEYPKQILNFVDNQFQPFKNCSTFTKFLPYSQNEISVSNSQSLDLVKAIQGANKSFLEWKNSSIEDRINLIVKVIKYLTENKELFSELESLDQGLPIHFSIKSNIEWSLQKLQLFKKELATVTAPSNLMYQPVGVVGVVLSYNLSTRLFVENVIPAILAGNSIVVKISSYAPVTGYLWGELFKHIGLPVGLVQILHSQDDSFKKLFISHPGIKAILATADLDHSTEIYKTVASVSRQQIKKIQIHSGSKNTTAVLKDLNESEMKLVMESFLFGQGQLAWNNSRLFILEKNEKIWTEYIQDFLNSLKISESIYDDSLWTPILKMSSRDQFQSIMKQAQADQAKILSSEKKSLSEQYLNPFFTKDMSNCSVLQQDQVCSPAYILSTVKYPFDVPKYSNVSYYGFSADIWTEVGKNEKVIQQLEVGHISLNQWSVYSTESINGVKQSSFGTADRKIFGSFFSNVKNLSV